MADKEAEQRTVAAHAPQIASPIPSGEHTVWADVSPLLEAACGGCCLFIYLPFVLLSDIVIAPYEKCYCVSCDRISFCDTEWR